MSDTTEEFGFRAEKIRVNTGDGPQEAIVMDGSPLTVKVGEAVLNLS